MRRFGTTFSTFQIHFNLNDSFLQFEQLWHLWELDGNCKSWFLHEHISTNVQRFHVCFKHTNTKLTWVNSKYFFAQKIEFIQLYLKRIRDVLLGKVHYAEFLNSYQNIETLGTNLNFSKLFSQFLNLLEQKYRSIRKRFCNADEILHRTLVSYVLVVLFKCNYFWRRKKEWRGGNGESSEALELYLTLWCKIRRISNSLFGDHQNQSEYKILNR